MDGMYVWRPGKRTAKVCARGKTGQRAILAKKYAFTGALVGARKKKRIGAQQTWSFPAGGREAKRKSPFDGQGVDSPGIGSFTAVDHVTCRSSA